MKNNILGYIFILFIISIMGFAIYRVNFQNENKNEESIPREISEREKNKGKEITLAISSFDTINPIITNNKDVQDIDKLIYEPLINITEEYKIEYILAEECAKITSNTYVIKLKSGIKWSDGQKFTSSDVKFTIDKLKERPNMPYSQNVKYIQEVDIIDNYTLRFILEHEINNFEYYLNFPILSSLFYAEEDFFNTSKNQAPSTTGQFKIAEVTNNTIVLQKNSKWWNKEKNSIIEKITINLYSTVAELYNAFKMGGIDLITTENAEYQNYIGTIGYDLSEIEGRNFIFLALNTKSRNLADTNIRKSIRSVLDKNRVIDNSYGNLYKICNFPLNNGNYLIEKTDENFYNPDEKNNEVQGIELSLVVRGSDETRVKAAEDIKNQLYEYGINVYLIYADDNMYNSYLNNKNYDMLLCNISQPIAPDLTTYFGYNNLARYENEEVNSIMSQINNITDENELKGKYQRIYEIYNEEVPYIGIARNKILALKNNRLVGEINSNWFNMFYNINDWYTNE